MATPLDSSPKNPYRTAQQGRAEKPVERFAVERRMQLVALLVLAAVILAATVFYAGPRNIFLPGWWRTDW